MKRKICIITGSRAEYGLLYWLLKELQADPAVDLQLLVTGKHLAPEFGETYRLIEEDGFRIHKKIDMLLASDSPAGVGKSMGLGMIGLADAYHELRPDLIVLLGDRYEMLSAAAAACVAGIPLAHIHGGETTQGAVDEAIRHSISKMSHLHFVSTAEYRNRVIQMGEDPGRVFNVGALGLENIRRLKLLNREDLEAAVDFDLTPRFVMVTFHPVTLEHGRARDQFLEVLAALDAFEDLRIIFTRANADAEGRVINRLIDKYVGENRHKARGFASMGQLNYLSAMSYAAAVIGNSSSGLLEAPSLHVPTVNIGDRQAGRIRAESVIDCRPEKGDIVRALEKVFSDEFVVSVRDISNPYDQPDTAKKIKEIIKSFDLRGILKKRFYDLDTGFGFPQKQRD